MKTLNLLAAAVVSAFAIAAYAGTYGPGGPGYGAGMGNCTGYGGGPGAAQGTGPLAGDCPGMGGGPARMFDRLRAADKDGNGSLSRDEIAGFPGLAANFDTIDANKDGQISLQELQGARGAGRGPRGQGWTRWDANGDGQLTREEVVNAPRLSQQFDAIDANHDGMLTAEELQSAHSRFAGRPRSF